MYGDYIRFHLSLSIPPSLPLPAPLFLVIVLSPSPPLSPSADSIILQLLLERDVVGVIVRMMEALPSHSSAQQVHNTIV